MKFLNEFLYFDELILWAVPVFILSVFLEAAWIIWARKERYPGRDALASIGMGLGSAVINTGMKSGVMVVFFWLYQHRVWTVPTDTWWGWILLFLADDFSFYLHHRACHEIRLFWAGHVNHHSSQHYNLAVALRQSWGELLHKYIWWAWMPFWGFHPGAMMVMLSISLIYQFFLHTESVKHLGWLELILNTPSHHRVHHGSNIRYLDRNHGGILIIWDKLFGTFTPETEKVQYGITKNIHTYNLWNIATHEYKALFQDVLRAPGWRNKLRYIFYPPGWSHDGSSQTAQELRKAQKSIKAAESSP
ncbi:MAG: sterol desaturase family protein [Flavobacteriales bacterium]|nr:sterol desaturase family protein [Flavobacteriales bacterium]MDW8432901.1 sterol desaturase family protein [Flavobacteriales bacterium]